MTPALPRREARAEEPDNRRTNHLKNPIRRFACLIALALPLAASAQSPAPAQLPLSRAAFQGLLQSFVSQEYLKGFRHLGDERDFDHGHLLFDGQSKLVAILYHTQELAGDHSKSDGFGFIDPGARNWIQWVSDGRVENAARYQRASYPSTATWDYFRVLELPALQSHHTVLPKMLDPKLGIDPAKTAQWVFTRVSCSASAPEASSSSMGEMKVVLPNREEVCLSLSAT